MAMGSGSHILGLAGWWAVPFALSVKRCSMLEQRGGLGGCLGKLAVLTVWLLSGIERCHWIGECIELVVAAAASVWVCCWEVCKMSWAVCGALSASRCGSVLLWLVLLGKRWANSCRLDWILHWRVTSSTGGCKSGKGTVNGSVVALTPINVEG